MRLRIWIAAGAIALWAVAIQTRLVYLQVVSHAELAAKADRQQLRTIAAPAKRAEIVDRNGLRPGLERGRRHDLRGADRDWR